MNAGPLDPLAAEVRDQIRADQAAIIDDLGERPAFWLAAAPLWTRTAAEAARFPVADVPSFIDRVLETGWAKSRGRVDTHFWIADDARRAVLDALRDRLRPRELQGWIGEMARAVSGIDARETSAKVPGALRAWADLIRTTKDIARLPAILVERATQAVADCDSARVQELAAACEALAALIEGTSSDDALDRARRLLTLGARRDYLERSLDHYLDRPELSDAVTRLLEPGNEQWALHLRGVGGVGKTMLIRYLLSGRYFTDSAPAPVPLAAVDFDRIAPDFPVRRPIQLLVELADELELQTAATERADRALELFRSRADTAHEALGTVRESGVPPLQHAAAARAVDDFAAVINEMGGALLILDTCEELAKLEINDSGAPAIRAMLDIIERLHERAPAVRVLLAGRRPLPSRSYLAVQPVAGFTVEESRRYLTAVVNRSLGDGLADAIIRQCAAHDGGIPGPGQLPDRVSPFDLALYAAWAEGDEDLDAAQVEKGGDGYVQRRIIARLEDPLVTGALPLLASAGRIRVETLAQAMDCDPAELHRRLIVQEWVDAEGDARGSVMMMPALARRVRAYFAAPGRRASVQARTERLAAALRSAAESAPLAEISADDLLAALRLSAPATAAALWDSIVGRAAVPPGHWGTVLNLTRRILGEWAEEEWPTTMALRAAILASSIAAGRRDAPLLDASGLWETVAACADDHPDPATRKVLRGRALLGKRPGWPDTESAWGLLRDIMGSAEAAKLLAPAVVDAAHRLLEAGAVTAAARLDRECRLDSPYVLEIPGLATWALVAKARLLADIDLAAASGALRQAESLAPRDMNEVPAFPDLILPEDLLARVRLERGLMDPPADSQSWQGWEAYAANHLDTVDGERLASLCLRLRLRHEVIPAAGIGRWADADGYRPDRTATGTAHDLVPPLFTSIAEAWQAAGYPERALAIVEEYRRAALGSRGDEATVRHADAHLLRLTRRFRLSNQRSLLTRLAAEDGPLQHAAWRGRAIVDRVPPIPPRAPDAQTWHAYWQSETDGGRSLPPLPKLAGDSPTGAADIRADLEELIQSRHPGPLPPATALADLNTLRQLTGLNVPAWAMLTEPSPVSRRSCEPYRYLRARMRQAALAGQSLLPDAGIPRRALADMAFEEAELTALRLPQVAVTLFDMSAEWYRDSSDHLGALLALAARYTAAGRPARYVERVEESLADLRAHSPEVYGSLTSEPSAGSPWQHWAAVLRPLAKPNGDPGAEEPPLTGVAVPRQDSADASIRQVASSGRDAYVAGRDQHIVYNTTHVVSAPPMTRAWERAERARTLRTFTLMATAAALVLSAAMTAFTARLASGASTGIEAVAAAIAGAQFALAIAAAWHGVKYLWFAGYRDVAVSPLATVAFDATISDDDARQADAISLSVGPRPWRSASPRARLLSWYPAIRRPGPVRGVAEFGYRGSLTNAATPDGQPLIRWSGIAPAADAAWWRRDTAPGTIRLSREDAAKPWERILVGSLGAASSGRVAWARVVESGVVQPPAAPKDGAAVRVTAPHGWTHDYARLAVPAKGRHIVYRAIGLAVTTAGGPAMDVAGDLLDARQIAAEPPQLVILEAKPADDARAPAATDDLPEKLALAAELIEDGIPAVLLLPVLPSTLASRISKEITAHARSRRRNDPRRLLATLRAIITPHVDSPVLDDVILFLNSCRFD